MGLGRQKPKTSCFYSFCFDHFRCSFRHKYRTSFCVALPTLDVNEGALDTIFSIYKQLLPGMGGYLVEAGKLQHGRLEMLTKQLATLEQETLEQRAKVLCLPSIPLFSFLLTPTHN